MDLYTQGWMMINAMLLLNVSQDGTEGDYPYTHCERVAVIQRDMADAYARRAGAWSISQYIDMVALPPIRARVDELRKDPSLRAEIGEAFRRYADTLLGR